MADQDAEEKSGHRREERTPPCFPGASRDTEDASRQLLLLLPLEVSQLLLLLRGSRQGNAVPGSDQPKGMAL